MASTHQEVVHRGPAIEADCYPDYAQDTNRVFPLYSWEVYCGSALMLIGMCALGLPITAFVYAMENGTVSIPIVVASTAVCLLFEAAGFALVVAGFKRNKRTDGEAEAH